MDFPSVWPQFLMAFLCNVATLSFGLQAGWLSPLQPALQSNDSSPLGKDTAPLTDDEISWIGALPSVTLVITPPIFGWTMDRFGRKFSLLLATAPNIITYLLLIFANNVNVVYASRLIGGFCSCGSFIVGPIYISECAQAHLKGTLGGLTGFFVKLGMMVSFVIGAFMSYLALNLISGSFTVIFVLMYLWMPESPVYLIRKGRWQEAEATLTKLWGSASQKLVIEEMKRLQETNGDSDRSKLEILMSFVTDRGLRTAALIVSAIFALQMFSGYGAILRYAVDIFFDAGVTFDPYVAAIMLGVSQLVSSFIGAFLIDRLGRKTLLVANLALMAFCMAALSAFLYVKADYPDHYIVSKLGLFPVISLVVFIACYGVAFGTVPFVIIPDLFSAETRATASTILTLWCSVIEFIVVKSFYSLTALVKLSGTLAVFSAFSLVGTFIIQVFMFETKGLSFDEIQMKLSGVKNIKEKETHKSNLPQPKTRPH